MDKPPKINIPETELDSSGFIKSGKTRFIKTVEDYSDLLFTKSISNGEGDKAKNDSREVTHDHVKAAAHSIAKSFGKPTKPGWFAAAKFGQYIAAGLVGLSVKNLTETWGLIMFIASFSVGGLLLFLTEKENSK